MLIFASSFLKDGSMHLLVFLVFFVLLRPCRIDTIKYTELLVYILKVCCVNAAAHFQAHIASYFKRRIWDNVPNLSLYRNHIWEKLTDPVPQPKDMWQHEKNVEVGSKYAK